MKENKIKIDLNPNNPNFERELRKLDFWFLITSMDIEKELKKRQSEINGI